MENTQEKQESKWRSRELGALWVRNGKNQKYLSGTVNIETMPGVTEAVKVVVFTNKNRDKNERAPDYVVYRSEDADSTTKVEQAAQQAAGEVSEQTQSTSSQQDKDIPEELF
tara:strand:+ start:138 stop:473 length:336 start_codon:yes stop_codon:yes gene_type:complete